MRIVKVFTMGCFDLLHVGHIRLLNRINALRDRTFEQSILTVGVIADSSVLTRKGRSPVIPDGERMECVRAIKGVDYVELITDTNLYAVWWLLKFNIVCVGDDWVDKLEYQKLLESFGVNFWFFDRTPDVSTTDIIERIGKGLEK